MPGEALFPFYWTEEIVRCKFSAQEIDEQGFTYLTNIAYAELAATIMWSAGEQQVHYGIAITLFDALKSAIPETEPGILALDPREFERLKTLYLETLSSESMQQQHKDPSALAKQGQAFSRRVVDIY